MAEVLTQSFVVRLKDMEAIIRNQSDLIEKQMQTIERLKTGNIFFYM